MKRLFTRPIVLIGIVGSGKSTIGKKLARKLNLQFYDSDKVIEEREGLSIVDIYDYKGEQYFRYLEESVIKEILNYGTLLLSTGGSTFMNEELRSLIKQKAISIWLSTDIETLYSRVTRRNTRPELNHGNKKAILQQMLDERSEIYNKADIIVESKDYDVHYIVDVIKSRLQKYIL